MNDRERFTAAGSGSGYRTRKKKTFSFFNLIIIILCFVLAVSILITIHMLRDSAGIYYDREATLYNYLTDGNYSALAERYYDHGPGNEEIPEIRKVSEYYAVGRYFEKAFFANAYEKAGKKDKAAQYYLQMEELEGEMGDFAGEKEKILKILQ